jgi:hypothetical protein
MRRMPLADIDSSGRRTGSPRARPSLGAVGEYAMRRVDNQTHSSLADSPRQVKETPRRLRYGRLRSEP